jgi:hypothetical protein
MRAALWMVVGVVGILVSLTSAVHGLGMIASPGFTDNFYSANDGLNEFKMKLAQIMSSADQGKENGVNEENQGVSNVSNANVSSTNSSDANRSTTNLSDRDLSTGYLILNNSSAPNRGVGNKSEYGSPESDSGGSMVSKSDLSSQSGLHFDNQASFNGVWSMQADRKGFGKSGINDRMALNGDFNVHKSISFKG